MKRLALHSLGILAAVLLSGGLASISASAETPQYGWYEENGGKYWYENGIRQGTEGRGKEIYDPSSDAWYWLDANEQGKVAVSKDVYQESNGGKWVRYDENGHMVKGENYANGGWYRFDEITGAMIKGWYAVTGQEGAVYTYYYDTNTGKMQKGEVTIDGVNCVFDVNTGIGYHQRWYEKNGAKYWYENGKRQGTEGRGKEIYDPGSGAWYWLDAAEQGKMAVSKDVYQESNGGKWVRYDSRGHMVKGHAVSNKKWYCFDAVTGAMIKGWYSETAADGTVNTYYFDPQTGHRYHGLAVIDKVNCAFDDTTGIALDQKWKTINNGKYWYEGGKRQGTTGRGKEIYDPASKAWYWLDAAEQGKMAVNKDVYQESNGGKWVRYNKDGHMVKGWNEKGGKNYYFDLTTGAMLKGKHTIDGVEYVFNKDTGVLERSEEEIPLNYVWDAVKITYMKPNGEVDYYTEKVYDDRDRIIQETSRFADGREKSSVSYAYDNDGNLLRETVYGEGHQKSYEQTYKYTNGLETETVYINAKDASKSYKMVTKYDAEQNITDQSTYNMSGKLTGSSKFFYKDGNLAQKTIYNEKGEAVNYYTYQYDSNKNKIKQSYWKYVGAVNNRIGLVISYDTYQYDRAGNVMLHTEYDGREQKEDTKGVEKRHTRYSYYTYAGVAYEKQAMIYNPDGSVISGYEYDRNGAVPVRYTEYGAKRTVNYYIEYDQTPYPTDRNVTTHITTDYKYDRTNNVKQMIKTEYRLNKYQD